MPELYDRMAQAFEAGASNEAIKEYIAPSLARIAVGHFDENFTAITHPLGFDSLHLETAGDRSVCVHDWCGCFNENEPVPNVVGSEHDHSWDMEGSRVLVGDVVDTQLDVVAGLYIPGATHFVFDTQTNGVGDTLTFLNQWASVTTKQSKPYNAGDTYDLMRGQPHSSVASDDLITILLARNYPGTTNRSFVPVNTPDRLVPFPYKEYSMLRVPLGRTRTRLLAEHIIEALGIEMPPRFTQHPDRIPAEIRTALPNRHVPGRRTDRPANRRFCIAKRLAYGGRLLI